MKASTALKIGLPVVLAVIGIYWAVTSLGGTTAGSDDDNPEISSTAENGISGSEFADAYDELVAGSGGPLLIPKTLPVGFTLRYSRPISTGGILEYGPEGSITLTSGRGSGTIRLIIGPQPAPDSSESFYEAQFAPDSTRDAIAFEALGASGQLVVAEFEDGFSSTFAKIDLDDAYVRVIGPEMPTDQIIEFIRSLRPWVTDVVPGGSGPDFLIVTPDAKFIEEAARDGFPLLYPGYLPAGWMPSGGGSGYEEDVITMMEPGYAKLKWDAWGDPQRAEGSMHVRQRGPNSTGGYSNGHFRPLDDKPSETVQIGDAEAILYQWNDKSVLIFRHPESGLDIEINSQNVSSDELIRITESLRPIDQSAD